MLLIKNIRLIDPASGIDGIRDILTDGDRVIRIAEDIDPGDRTLVTDEDALILDGTDLAAAPGLVDVHVHFRDPGFTYKEDVSTGARAAAAGGFTSVVCMANTKPPADNPDTVRYVMEKGRDTDIHVYQAGCISLGMSGKELCDFEELMAAGAPGFTDDGKPLLDAALVESAMTESARLSVPLSFHEEDPAYITENGINSGMASEYLGVKGSPRQAEISMIDRDMELALRTGAIINIQHISTAQGVELVRQAVKKQGEKRTIHAEATPHHFTLTEEAVREKGALAKMNPPLRTEEDRQAIIQGLQDGTIDIIATDHAPHSAEEKAGPVTEAPSGIIGLETALALGISELVKPGYLSLLQLIEKMSFNPAGLYGLDAGYLREKGPADIVIFDPDEEWVFEESDIKSKSHNSPFIGRRLTGRVKALICGGIIVK